MDRKAYVFAAAWGGGAHLFLVLVGHFLSVVADYLYGMGGLLIAGAAGLIYARRAQRGLFQGAALAAATGALVAIAVAVLLDDMAAPILIIGPLVAAFAGFVGALLEDALAARKVRS